MGEYKLSRAYEPYPEIAPVTTIGPKECWEKVDETEFVRVRNQVLCQDGKVELNALGAELLYFGTRLVNATDVPRLIGTRSPQGCSIDRNHQPK